MASGDDAEPAPEGPDESGVLRFDVADENAGLRLDRFLAAALETSRAQVRRLLESGRVRVDGGTAGSRAKGRSLAAGARVEVEGFRSVEDQRIVPEPAAPGRALRVLAEGEGWLAVDKPAGAPVHPLLEDETGTVLNSVAAMHPGVQGVGERGLRSGVVHRLDVDTSGVMLVATAQPAWERLREAFRTHVVEKRYRAIVAGEFAAPLEQEVGLVVARHRPARVRVVDDASDSGEGGWRAVQRIRPVEALSGATLVEITPRTGFLHQIRATLAALGHPLLGDATYADAATRERAPRHMLHAARLGFEEIAAESPDAEDFASVLSRLRAPDFAG